MHEPETATAGSAARACCPAILTATAAVVPAVTTAVTATAAKMANLRLLPSMEVPSDVAAVGKGSDRAPLAARSAADPPWAHGGPAVPQGQYQLSLVGP